MQGDSYKLLWDAAQAAERIQRFVHEKSYDDYAADELLRSAVERQFEILGEALARLRQIDQQTALGIAELPRVVGFRNVLIHAYATVDHRIVWGIVEADLMPLRGTLQRLLPQE